MPYAIRHRQTRAVLFSSETATTIAEAVAEAVRLRANLSDANLSDANLSCANLSCANLSFADLSRAVLSRANLAYANLSGANLAYADLSDADLSRANLSDANLSDANLAYADLSFADLSRAVLSDANLSCADLSRADLSYAIGVPGKPETEPSQEIPTIPRIHNTLLEAINAQGCKLDMGAWHTCKTTHCRAGWVVRLAGDAGAELEAKHGTAQAARMIYRASDPGCRSPWFHASNEWAMKDIVRCAELETKNGTAAEPAQA